ncbi:hypothetical protein M514_28440 [Trichuris suis]|uniref:Uncharacterized protein n=1 Tax=Trichuris suis TaxID=68888 RepID=A0A085MQ84_9BILA|nr:hypothetical protein M514_28440 [Trichuris suis]
MAGPEAMMIGPVKKAISALQPSARDCQLASIKLKLYKANKPACKVTGKQIYHCSSAPFVEHLCPPPNCSYG